MAAASHLWLVLCLQPAASPGAGGDDSQPAPPDAVSALRGDARLLPALSLLAARPDALGRRVAVGCVSALTGFTYDGDPAPAPAVVIRDLTRPLRRLARAPDSDTLTVRVVASAAAAGAGPSSAANEQQQPQQGQRQPETPPLADATAAQEAGQSQASSPGAAPGAVLAELRGNMELLCARCPFIRDRVTEEMRAAGRGTVDVGDDEARRNCASSLNPSIAYMGPSLVRKRAAHAAGRDENRERSSQRRRTNLRPSNLRPPAPQVPPLALESVLAYCATGAAVVAALPEALAVAAAAERMGLPELQADMEDIAKARGQPGSGYPDWGTRGTGGTRRLALSDPPRSPRHAALLMCARARRPSDAT